MTAPRFDWDDANIRHIAEHGVLPAEVEEAAADPYRTPAQTYSTPVERRQAFLGRTVAGRLLYIVLTIRAGRFRVVTAYTASSAQPRYYRGPRRQP